jgi:hypothetical protein
MESYFENCGHGGVALAFAAGNPAKTRAPGHENVWVIP